MYVIFNSEIHSGGLFKYYAAVICVQLKNAQVLAMYVRLLYFVTLQFHFPLNDFLNAHTHTAWSLQARWAWCRSRSIQVFPWTVPVTTRPGITSTLWWVPPSSVPGMQEGGREVTLLLVLPSTIGKALNQGSLYVCTYICIWQSHLWLVSRFLACGRRISGWPLEF